MCFKHFIHFCFFVCSHALASLVIPELTARLQRLGDKMGEYFGSSFVSADNTKAANVAGSGAGFGASNGAGGKANAGDESGGISEFEVTPKRFTSFVTQLKVNNPRFL